MIQNRKEGRQNFRTNQGDSLATPSLVIPQAASLAPRAVMHSSRITLLLLRLHLLRHSSFSYYIYTSAFSDIWQLNCFLKICYLLLLLSRKLL